MTHSDPADLARADARTFLTDLVERAALDLADDDEPPPPRPSLVLPAAVGMLALWHALAFAQAGAPVAAAVALVVGVAATARVARG